MRALNNGCFHGDTYLWGDVDLHFLSDSGTKMQGEGSGRRPSSHYYEKEALIVTTAVFTKATEFPAGLCASGELRVQYRQFLSLTRSHSLSYNHFCAWLSDLWPQLKNTHHHLTFRSNKITSRLAPLDKVVLFSRISSLPPCYQIIPLMFLNSAWLP